MSEQMDWRQAAAARGLKVTDLAEHVGTSIEGIDLADEHDAEIGRHHTRRLRGAHAAVVSAARPSSSPAAISRSPAISAAGPTCIRCATIACPSTTRSSWSATCTRRRPTRARPRVGLNWHTDHYHLPEPGLFTYLHAIQVPPEQGDTRYANGIAAYEALPPEVRAKIEDKKVLHSRARLFRNLFPEATEEEMEAERRKIPDVFHPLVRTHPELRRRGLYLGGEWGSCIEGMEPDEAQALYDELLHHMIQDRFCYRHRWQPGDVLMSDNRCSLHRASEWDEGDHVRRLHRIIMIDDRAPY